MTTTKRIGIAAGVLVLLAGSGFGLVHWEGRMWDERVAQIAANPPQGIRVAYGGNGPHLENPHLPGARGSGRTSRGLGRERGNGLGHAHRAYPQSG